MHSQLSRCQLQLLASTTQAGDDAHPSKLPMSHAIMPHEQMIAYCTMPHAVAYDRARQVRDQAQTLAPKP